MKEIQVITDVSLSPDSAELILARQTLVAEGGQFHPVGDPVESRLSLLVPRVKISFGASDDTMSGFVAVVYVQNVSLFPFEITKVSLSVEYPEPRKVKIGERDAKLIGGAYGFIPKDHNDVGLLLPRGIGEYYLPAHLEEVVRATASALPAMNVKVLVYSGNEVVGEAPASELITFIDLSRQSRPGTVRFSNRVRHPVNGLDAETRDIVHSALHDLAAIDPGEWTNDPRLSNAENDLYFFSLPPDFKILLRPLKQGGIEVLDVIRVGRAKTNWPHPLYTQCCP